jgi:hypothetical protein
MRQMLDRRTNTRVVPLVGSESIRDFFRHLKSNNLTAGDLLVGSHATNEGVLFIDLDSLRSGHPATFEDLEAVEQDRTMEIPAGVGSSDTRFHVKGCRIGSDECRPYLTKLKSALGNPKQVTAPKFFHGLYPRNATGKDGIFEWMAHSYEVIAKTAFDTREKLVKAFQDRHFKRLDGTTPVEDADINRWVTTTLKLKPVLEDKVYFPVPVKIVPAMGSVSAIDNFTGQCRSLRDTFTFQNVPGVSVPQNQTELKTALQGVDDLKSTHPYPIFTRMRFARFDDFFDGMDWVRQGNDWIGTHFVYTLVIPVMKIVMPPPPPPAPPPTPVEPNELIFNFYPPTGAPTMHFLEDNPTFFGQV